MRPAPPGGDLPKLSGDQAPGAQVGEGEDRRTPVGRFIRAWSLDELPQLINVLREQMSLVGPRPERPELVEEFADHVRRYNWSLWLDLKILLMTIPTVLRRSE